MVDVVWFKKIGVYYGYPSCCIDDWIARTIIANPAIQPSWDQERAGDYTGFLPCPTHAKQVLDKKIALKDLVQNRQCEIPFDD